MSARANASVLIAEVTVTPWVMPRVLQATARVVHNIAHPTPSAISVRHSARKPAEFTSPSDFSVGHADPRAVQGLLP